MSTINVQCVDQAMEIMNSPIIASGGQNEDNIQFSFSSEWDGFVKVCALWQEAGQYWLAMIDSNDSCVIPAEAMAHDGTMHFGVVGVKENVQRTSEVIAYRLREGVVTNVDDPTPSIYQQILQHVAVADQALEDVQALSDYVNEQIELQNEKIDEMGVQQFENRLSTVETNQGDLSDLETESKSDLVSAVNELFMSASNGKTAIATAITGKGVPTSATDSFEVMASNIGDIETDPVLQSKSVTPTEESQQVTPDSGYDGLSSVTVSAIDRLYVGSGVTRKSAETFMPGTSDKTIAADQYLTGIQRINGDANLVAGNILQNVSIFGVTGNVQQFKSVDVNLSYHLNDPVAYIDVTSSFPSNIVAIFGNANVSSQIYSMKAICLTKTGTSAVSGFAIYIDYVDPLTHTGDMIAYGVNYSDALTVSGWGTNQISLTSKIGSNAWYNGLKKVTVIGY